MIGATHAATARGCRGALVLMNVVLDDMLGSQPRQLGQLGQYGKRRSWTDLPPSRLNWLEFYGRSSAATITMSTIGLAWTRSVFKRHHSSGRPINGSRRQPEDDDEHGDDDSDDDDDDSNNNNKQNSEHRTQPCSPVLYKVQVRIIIINVI